MTTPINPLRSIFFPICEAAFAKKMLTSVSHALQCYNISPPSRTLSALCWFRSRMSLSPGAQERDAAPLQRLPQLAMFFTQFNHFLHIKDREIHKVKRKCTISDKSVKAPPLTLLLKAVKASQTRDVFSFTVITAKIRAASMSDKGRGKWTEQLWWKKEVIKGFCFVFFSPLTPNTLVIYFFVYLFVCSLTLFQWLLY